MQQGCSSREGEAIVVVCSKGADWLSFSFSFGCPRAAKMSTVGSEIQCSRGWRTMRRIRTKRRKTVGCGFLPAEQVASAQSHEVDLAGSSRPDGGEEHLRRIERWLESFTTRYDQFAPTPAE